MSLTMTMIITIIVIPPRTWTWPNRRTLIISVIIQTAVLIPSGSQATLLPLRLLSLFLQTAIPSLQTQQSNLALPRTFRICLFFLFIHSFKIPFFSLLGVVVVVDFQSTDLERFLGILFIAWVVCTALHLDIALFVCFIQFSFAFPLQSVSIQYPS